MSQAHGGAAALLLIGWSGLALALAAPGVARGAADVPAGKEVLLLERIPGKTGKVRFGHADHVRRYTRPDGTPIRCRDCHHTLAADDPPTPLPPMRCSGCHAALGEPPREIDGRLAPPMARLKPDGAIDRTTILFHEYCRACHKKLAASARKLATCKACHERGVSSESLHGRYDAVAQPGTTLSWLRCLAGQRWTGSRCEGAATLLSPGAAAGACPAGYRLPTQAELLGLLDGCRPGGGPCRPCGKSAACSTLLGGDPSVAWAAPGPGGPGLAVDLDAGVVRRVEAGRPQAVRCVQSSATGADPG